MLRSVSSSFHRAKLRFFASPSITVLLKNELSQQHSNVPSPKYTISKRDYSTESQKPPSKIPLSAKFIGFAGVVPFAVTSYMGFYVPEIGGFMQNIQIVYSACVLASSGGIQGGLLLSNKSPESLSQTILRYSLSILPPVLGISTLIIPTIIQLDPLYTQVVQLAGLNLTLIGEFLLNHTGLPAPWYLKLRFWLTGAASLCIGVMIYSELKWAGRIIPPPLKMSF